jgi:16S rRNA U516 pseudouridylate synthase RsuA-like enzyme
MSPHLGVKPTRVTDPQLLLKKGDYLRIHHNPRRFPDVYRYRWDRPYEPNRNDGHDDERTGIITTHQGRGLDDADNSNNDDDEQWMMLPGVVVACNDTLGWLVLNKPERVPVHMTVDNSRENVQWCVRQAKIRRKMAHQITHLQGDSGKNLSLRQDEESSPDNDTIYVSTPQRLDQNTSGLLVLATSKAFASYFAGLLRSKTHQQLLNVSNDEAGADASMSSSRGYSSSEDNDADHHESSPIHKLYRWYVVSILLYLLSRRRHQVRNGCEASHEHVFFLPSFPISLVCLSGSDKTSSVRDAAMWLQSRAESGETIRHFLEPSIRAPKRFVREPPPADASDASSWQECLLRIRRVGPVCAVLGNEPGRNLAASLWSTSNFEESGHDGSCGVESSSSRRPASVHAVAELEVELLTGRTHQIRGQLSAEGFPLVGDVQYGGADDGAPDEGVDRLALQCCQLEFIDPDIVQTSDGTVNMTHSLRWNRFRLHHAWWTPLVDRYQQESSSLSDDDRTTDLAFESPGPSSNTCSNRAEAKAHLLPPRVSLSPGRNKYVLIRASHPTDPDAQEEWFVKSAAPSECGGPYHGNVAQDLREWIEAAGYKATVTGGGRIYFRPDENCALVFGFSYGFGRGDHDRAADIVRQSGIYATVDHSPDLY